MPFISILSAAANALAVCSDPPFSSFSALSTYAPAETFCANNYPLPVVTSTLVLPAVVQTIMGVASTVMLAGAADFVTIPTPTAIRAVKAVPEVFAVDTTITVMPSITTTISSSTIVATTFSTAVVEKRSVSVVVYEAASLFTSLTNLPANVVATVCSCIGTPSTKVVVSFSPP